MIEIFTNTIHLHKQRPACSGPFVLCINDAALLSILWELADVIPNRETDTVPAGTTGGSVEYI